MTSSSDLTDQLMEKAKLAVSGRAPVIKSRFSIIVTPELERSTEWIRSLQLSLYKTNVKVAGYKLYVVEEWLDESPFLFCSVMVATGRSSDTVLCNVLRVTGNSTAEQHRLVQDNFVAPRMPGLSVQPVLSGGHKLGDLVVCDPDLLRWEGQPLHLAEVAQGALQGDVLPNVRLNAVLRLFNCISHSARLTAAPPSADVAERFDQMYRSLLHGGGKALDVPFRALVRRLYRRVHGALTVLLYLSADSESSSAMPSKSFLKALDRYRADQPHQTMGLTPELLRKMRGEVESLARSFAVRGYPVPSDPWAEHNRFQQLVRDACSQYGIFPDRSSFDLLLRNLEQEPEVSGVGGESGLGGSASAEAMSEATSSVALGVGSPMPGNVRKNSNPSAMRDMSPSVQGAGSNKLLQLKEAAEVMEVRMSEQRQEIIQAQANYDSLYERYTAVTTKMYEALEELNSYKLRVEELEGQFKRLDHDWSSTTDAIREYNETFTNFEARVLRLDEHVNNMYRQRRGWLVRFGFWLLTWLVWLIGTIFGYGVSFVYLFRGGSKSKEAKAAKKKIVSEVDHILDTFDPERDK